MDRSRPLRRALLPLVLAVLVVAAAWQPPTLGTRHVSAADPSPAPSASASPDPAPSPTLPSDPTPSPTADPSPDPSSTPAPDPSPSPSPSPSSSPTTPPSPSPSPAPTPNPNGLRVGHTWVDTVGAANKVTGQGKADAGLAGMTRFVVYRVRFQVANSSDQPVGFTPTLEVGTGPAPASWSTVPVVDPVRDQPFYVASDDGPTFRVRTAGIATSGLRSANAPGASMQAVAGLTSAGVNPAPSMTLPGNAWTEVEFAVRATVSAAWDGTYAFRLQPGPDTVDAGAPVVVTLRSKPPIIRTLPASTTRQTAAQASPQEPRYQLVVAVTRPAGGASYPLAATVDPTSPHIVSGLTSDTCAVCHRTHTAPDEPLLAGAYRIDPLRSAAEPYAGADFALCISCHDESPFADTSGSANPLTNFPGHGYHLGLIENVGLGGVEITTPGDGQGNALCAECHYNVHGVETSERGLVKFAPDVIPYDGADPAHVGELVYDQATESCTLTCHGKAHDGLSFQATQPGT